MCLAAPPVANDMAYNYDLRPVSTKSQLLTYIGIEEEWFDMACNFDVAAYDRMQNDRADSEVIDLAAGSFWRHEIPKRNPARGRRVVWEAGPPFRDAYKGLARRLSRFLETAIPGFPHEQCFGYVRGRNIRDNAKMHLGAALLLKADIKDFFPSIQLQRVEGLFTGLGLETGTASELARFLTIGGQLPLGLATSPVIANAICYGLDVDLSNLAKVTGSTYSRYADDLTYSSGGALPDILSVSEVVARHGFSLAMEKTRVSKLGQNHYVTGLSVSDSRAPHAPRSMKRSLRQELFFAKKFGLEDHIKSLGITGSTEIQRYVNHLDGRVKYVAFHEPHKAAGLVTQWRAILEEDGSEPSFEPKNQNQAEFSFFVDETEFVWQEKRYLALGLSATQQQDRINSVTERILKDYLANPFSDGDIEAVTKNGMHFYDAPEDLKSTYVRALQTLPFQGYIVFGEQTGDFEGDYTRLLAHVIKRRLMAAESKAALMCFEQSDKVSKNAIEAVVRDAWGQLARANNRRPKYVNVEMVDKSNFGVGVPDFLLGVFRKYISSDPNASPPPRHQNMFEGLRDKIRVIVNADTAEEFTRRQQFDNSSIGRDREG